MEIFKIILKPHIKIQKQALKSDVKDVILFLAKILKSILVGKDVLFVEAHLEKK